MAVRQSSRGKVPAIGTVNLPSAGELREFGEYVEAIEGLDVIFVEAVADAEFGGGGEVGDREDAFRIAAGDLRLDVSAEDIAASLLGIFTVAGKPEHHAQASRLLNLLMDGLRPPAT
jgi:hypothetical protein